MKGRYRWRTRLRTMLPGPIARVIPKGRADCGNHEWYKQDDHVDRCYHCVVGIRPHQDLPNELSLEKEILARGLDD